MSLTASIAGVVPQPEREAGRRLFEAGAVVGARRIRNLLSAMVYDAGRYPVYVVLGEQDLPDDGSCPCEFFRAQHTPCRHIWATLLDAETSLERGRPEIDRAERRSDPRVPWPGAPAAASSQGAGGGKPAAVPAWSRQLAMLVAAQPERRAYGYGRSPGRSSLAGGELSYVIDVTDTLRRADGRLTFQVFVRQAKPGGQAGKAKVCRNDQLVVEDLPDELDRQAVALVKSGEVGYNYGGYTSRFEESFRVGPAVWRSLLPLVCRAGRAKLRPRPEQEFEDLSPLAWEDEPWSFVLEARHDPDRRAYVLAGSLRRGGPEGAAGAAAGTATRRIDVRAPQLVLAGGLVFHEGVAAPLEARGGFQWIAGLRDPKLSIAVPEDQVAAFQEQLYSAAATPAGLPRLDLPEALRLPEVMAPPRPALRVRPGKPGEAHPERLRCELSFDYGGLVVTASEGDAASAFAAFDRERRRLIIRDAAAESAALARLLELGARVVTATYYRPRELHLSPRRLPHLVRTLAPEGWRIEADGKLYRQPGRFDLAVTSGIDWFDLNATVEFGDQRVALPALLAALKRGDSTVVLSDGTLGVLPEEWLAKHALLAATGEAQADGSLRFRRCQAGLLDALLAAQPEARLDEVFARVRQELRTFDGVRPKEKPPQFRGTLRPYQREALGWFDFLARFGFGGCLADDMGLGKTVQVLAMLAARKEEGRRRKDEPDDAQSGSAFSLHPSAFAPSLVVVPRSLVFNWKQEAARFAPTLRVLDNSGPQRLRSAEELAAYDVVLTTYGTLRRDAAFLKDVTFEHVILDEAQAIKNPESESAKAARLLAARHRLALSGTPIQNHLGDLWSLFDFLNPGMLGAAAVFSALTGGNGGGGGGGGGGNGAGASLRNPSAQARELLAQAVRPFILRRTKEQVASDLPQRQEQTLFCELEPRQRKLYDELRDHYRAALLQKIDAVGMARAKIQVLEALLRLRQAALHPGLIDQAHADAPCAKLDTLLPRLEEVIEEGHKALVFSQFTGMLALVRRELDGRKVRYEYLDGKTRDRQARVDRFQADPECRLFLISLKAGGLGLNLTAADYVFLLDPWWNPAIEAQAIDRAHRIGQTKQVFACRLIAKDTVEEKVLALQETKRELADAIINADNALIRTLRRDDLERLLS